MNGDSAADVDPEALLDQLIEADIIEERPDGVLAATSAFESTHAVYRDTYLELGDDQFRDTVAQAFGIDEAAARIEELGVSRAELAAYLALQSALENPPGPIELATMAAIVVEVAPPSPVPRDQLELDDDSYESFLADHDDAVVFVWKLDCAPCERMKAELDELLEVAPEHCAVAGIDGESAEAFRRQFDVTAAPTTLRFRDGEVVAAESGRLTREGFTALLEESREEN